MGQRNNLHSDFANRAEAESRTKRGMVLRPRFPAIADKDMGK